MKHSTFYPDVNGAIASFFSALDLYIKDSFILFSYLFLAKNKK